MTGILIVAVTALLLVLALEPAHRRAGRDGWRPGVLWDRDHARLISDLRQRGTVGETGSRRHHA